MVLKVALIMSTLLPIMEGKKEKNMKINVIAVIDEKKQHSRGLTPKVVGFNSLNNNNRSLTAPLGYRRF